MQETQFDRERMLLGDDALDLLKEQKILITAGTGFNWGEPDHFRIVYLPDLVSLKEASVRLEKFFGSYRQKD